MIILWTIAVVVILFLAGSAVFCRLQVKKLKHLEHILDEAVWQRRNKIPLLIEMARKAGIKDIDNVIPDLIGDLDSRLRGNDKKNCRSDIEDIFRRGEQNLGLVALKKEFEEDSAQIKIALNDYTFEKARFSWFVSKILGFKKL